MSRCCIHDSHYRGYSRRETFNIQHLYLISLLERDIQAVHDWAQGHDGHYRRKWLVTQHVLNQDVQATDQATHDCGQRYHAHSYFSRTSPKEIASTEASWGKSGANHIDCVKRHGSNQLNDPVGRRRISAQLECVKYCTVIFR